MKIVAYSSFVIIGALAGFFLSSASSRERCRVIRDDHKRREHLSDDQIDTMLADTFPASDPPSTY